MPPNQPVLGSLAVQGPSLNPQTIHVSSATCHNLSLFKDILKEYRRLDDTIVMRLNRANAAMRDEDRIHGLTGNKSLQDQACENIWRELVANWKRRTQLVQYCVSVVDKSLSEKRLVLEESSQDAASMRKVQGEVYADEVKRKQVHNELRVESIVRRRSADEHPPPFAAFRSRCQYFNPPQSDSETYKLWEASQK